MQISSASSSSASTAGGSSVAIDLSSVVATLSDNSKASSDEKLAAYSALRNALAFTGGAYARSLSKDELAKAIDAFNNSDYAKQVEAVTDRYQSLGMALADTIRHSDNVNGAQTQLSVLNQFSADDQKILFLSLGRADKNNFENGVNIRYDDVDAWMADLRSRAGSQSTPAVQVTLSDAAKAILANGADASNNAKDAKHALNVSPTSNGKADVALQLLKAGEEARAKQQEADRKDLFDVSPTILANDKSK